MFDFLGELWDNISNATSTIDWGSVATDSLTTSLAGAAVGALASAVSDGDIGEGLLYGAAGGLVAGGLMEFGTQFSDNWNWASSQPQVNLGQVSLGVDISDIGKEYDLDLSDFAEGATVAASGASTPTEASYMKQFMGSYAPQERSMWEVLGPSALTVGGNMLAGAFAKDPVDQQKELMEAGWKREDQLGQRATGALASVHTPRGAAVVDKSEPVRQEFQDIKEAVTV